MRFKVGDFVVITSEYLKSYPNHDGIWKIVEVFSFGYQIHKGDLWISIDEKYVQDSFPSYVNEAGKI